MYPNFFMLLTSDASSTGESVTETMEEVINKTVEDQLLDKVLIHIQNGLLRQWLREVLPGTVSFIWSVALSIIIFAVGFRLIQLVTYLVRRILSQSGKIDKGVVQFTGSLAKIASYVLLVIVVLGLFGVEASSIAAAVASAGLTIGLAFQGTLSNFAGGVLILMTHPFVVGDYIIEDTHKNEGFVTEVSIIYTKLRTYDNKVIVIPNGNLANSSMTNLTMKDKRRVDLFIPISYKANLQMAKDVLSLVIRDEPRRLSGEDVEVFVHELGDSSVDMGVRFWVKTEDYWDAKHNALEQIIKHLDEAGIEIPYNQMDVHLKKEGIPGVFSGISS